jgi:hypothetical protein
LEDGLLSDPSPSVKVGCECWMLTLGEDRLRHHKPCQILLSPTGQSWRASADDCYWSGPCITNSPGIPQGSSGMPGIVMHGLPWGQWDVC